MSGRGSHWVGPASSQALQPPSPRSSPMKPGHQYSVRAVSTAHGGGASGASTKETLITPVIDYLVVLRFSWAMRKKMSEKVAKLEGGMIRAV
jgi:hypothetical protein